MKIQIHQPVALHEQGKRDYSEDYLFPALGEANEEQRIFLVCDGVGGSVRGDMASKIVSKEFSNFVQKDIDAGQIQGSDYRQDSQQIILNGYLKQTEEFMDNAVAENPEIEGMATTMTYLHLSDYAAVVAWAGDSRVYHFASDGTIKNVTSDHSLVNELVKRGEITPEDALTHPRRNVILRAISGTENPTKVDVKIIPLSEIDAGDYFLLCTDGILEAWSDEELTALIGSDKELEKMKSDIRQKCQELSRDNFSMYLLQVSEVASGHDDDTAIVGATASASAASAAVPVNHSMPPVDEDTNKNLREALQKGPMLKQPQVAEKPKFSKTFWIGLAAAIVLAALLLFGYFMQENTAEDFNTHFKSFKNEIPKQETLMDSLDLMLEFKNDWEKLALENDVIKKSIETFKLQDKIDALEKEKKKVEGIVTKNLTALKETYSKKEKELKDGDATLAAENNGKIDLLEKRIEKACDRLNDNFDACEEFKDLKKEKRKSFSDLSADMNAENGIDSGVPKEEDATPGDAGKELAINGKDDDIKDKPAPPPPSNKEIKKGYNLGGEKFDFPIRPEKSGGTGIKIGKRRISRGFEYVVFDWAGENVIGKFDDIQTFHNGYAVVKKDGKFGYIGLDGLVLGVNQTGGIKFKNASNFGTTCDGHGVVTRDDGKEKYLSTYGYLQSDCDEK